MFAPTVAARPVAIDAAEIRYADLLVVGGGDVEVLAVFHEGGVAWFRGEAGEYQLRHGSTVERVVEGWRR